MGRNKYSRRTGYGLVHDAIRGTIGYGRLFSSADFSRVMNVTRGVNFAPGVTLDNLLDDLVRYKFVKPFYEAGKTAEYMLVRIDRREEPVVGFNPLRR